MKKLLMFLMAAVFLSLPLTAAALMGTMGMKSDDVEGQFFGRIKIYPHYIGDVNFKDKGTVMDEGGNMAELSMRDEARFGWLGGGENWSFKIALEADLVASQKTVDRGTSRDGSSGANFGVEKLAMTYNLPYFQLEAGWDDRFLDVQSGGLLYGDDHPFLGLRGKLGEQFSWEALYTVIQDDTDLAPVGTGDADFFDWRLYSLKGIYKFNNGFAVSPFYAYSDLGENYNDAKVSYLGAEAYGKLGWVTPRAEFVYATGGTDADATGTDYDISAWAAYGSLEFDVSPAFQPYVGVFYETGDDDAGDDDIKAFNAIGPITRYTPTFGLENAMIYRYVPALGSFLYANNFNMLGGSSATPGYGEHYTASRNAPGLVAYGLGARGSLGKFSYVAQAQLFQLDETGALEDFYGRSVSDTVGVEYDLWLKYQFNKHFSLGNCFSVFDPDDAVQDIAGDDDADEIAIINTVELVWQW